MPKYKRVTIVPPIITPSRSRLQLRQENERLIAHLQRLERGPFGLCNLFK